MRQLTALLWKEWRQQRALLIGLVVGWPVFVAASFAFAGVNDRPGDSVASAGVAFVVFAAAVLPAAAIAGERRAGTLAFLRQQPASVGNVFLTKTLVGLLLWLGLIAMVGVTGRVWSAPAPFLTLGFDVVRPGGFGMEGDHSWAEFAASLLRLLPVFLCCLAASAVVRRPILAVLLGGVGAYLLLVVLIALAPLHSNLFVYLGETLGWWGRLARLGARTVLSAWLLGLGWWLFVRVRDDIVSAWRRAALLALGAAATPCVVVLPLVAAYAVEQAAFAALEPRDARRVVGVAPAPGGRPQLVFSAQFEGSPLLWTVDGVCLLDWETGQARLLSWCPGSRLYPPPWSPDGRYVVYSELAPWSEYAHGIRGDLLWRLCPSWYHELQVVDATTGEPARRDAHGLRDARCHGWLDERRMLVGGIWIDEWPSRFCCYDVCTGALTPIQLSAARWSAEGRWGTLFLAEYVGREDRRLATYDRGSARWVVHALPRGLEVLEVSSDGRHALAVGVPVEEEDVPVVLLGLRDGSRKVLLEGPYRDGMHLGHVFLPDAHWLYLSAHRDSGPSTGDAWLLDTATGRRVRLQLADRIGHCGARFTPDSRKLVWTCGYYARATTDKWFHVHDIATGRTTALPIRRGTTICWGAASALTNDSVFFTCSTAAIYRIRLDGTGLERVFPGRKPMTLGEFEAMNPPW